MAVKVTGDINLQVLARNLAQVILKNLMEARTQRAADDAKTALPKLVQLKDKTPPPAA